MNYITKKHTIKIPKNISVYYCDITRVVIFANSFIQESYVSKTKLIIEKKKRIINVTREPFFNTSTNEKKKLKAVQGTQVNLFKQILFDISFFFCKKLNLVGVGFRVSKLKLLNLNLLHFKLGYSHFIYFKIPKNIEIFCSKNNRLFVFGYSYLFVTQMAALIRSFKIPEPYKGKGIVYTTEKLILKEGKKV